MIVHQPCRNFQDLVVWQRAHELVLDVYRQSSVFPKTETYGLTSQLRRAAVSIPANIAEGFVKRSKLDKAGLMNIAQGSLEETRYYLILANDLGYLNNLEVMPQVDDVARLLNRYVSVVRSSSSNF